MYAEHFGNKPFGAGGFTASLQCESLQEYLHRTHQHELLCSGSNKSDRLQLLCLMCLMQLPADSCHSCPYTLRCTSCSHTPARVFAVTLPVLMSSAASPSTTHQSAWMRLPNTAPAGAVPAAATKQQ
jgi:hypothetical protein